MAFQEKLLFLQKMFSYEKIIYFHHCACGIGSGYEIHGAAN
jgi:hypothetical protein